MVGFVVTIGLAVAGAGYWSLVIGLVVGRGPRRVGGLVVVALPDALRWDRATAARVLLVLLAAVHRQRFGAC